MGKDGEFLPSSDLIRVLGTEFCGKFVGSIVCENFMFFLAGYDSEEMNVVTIIRILVFLLVW